MTNLRIKIAEFLQTKIIEYKEFHIDLWHFVHLFFGFFIMKYFFFEKVSKPFLWLFFLLVAWEIFELVIISSGSGLFTVESKMNILFDLIIGMIGGWIFIKWFT